MMYYIGLDIGTSSVKALLVSEEGEVGFRNAEYPSNAQALWAETTLKFGGRQPAKP